MIRIVRSREDDLAWLKERDAAAADVRDAVSEILKDVRRNGDEALRRLGKRFDGVSPDPLEVSEEMIGAAVQEVGEEFLGVLERTARNIREYHLKQKREGFCYTRDDGSVLGQRILPLERVGIYSPGGTAAYPSTVLMNAIPAKIAGCREIIMVSPPQGGKIPAQVLAAARVAGVDRIFQTGGSQAVAALAYGTESIPRVDKIVGPGNLYVAEAKRQVFGQVSIDMIAGPSEILIISDALSDPACLAADLLSQAEHDKNASAILLTDSEELAEQTARELERQLPILPRREIAEVSIRKNGRIVLCRDIREAAELADRIAPEHLELCVEEPFRLLEEVRNAGSVFLGRNTPEAIGDYGAGPNHILPTGGTARFSSALGVDDFVKKIQYINYSPEGLAKAAPDVVRFAEEEGLQAHARSVLIRQEGREDS